MKKYLIIISVLVSVFSKAQEYKFNVFSQEQGLPQPYVYDLVQNKKGFLYVATGDGLAVYFGSKMIKYNKKDSLAENYCSSLFIDSKDNIWVGHFEGHVTFGEGKKFTKIKTNEEALARVVSFGEDSKNNIYFANAAGGLYVIKEGKAVLFSEEELPPINQMKIHQDKIYLATQEGLLFYDLGNRSRSSKTIEGTQGKNISCIEISPRNELWLGVDGVGVELFLNGGSSGYKSQMIFSDELKSQKKNIKNICLKGDNEMWISLTGEGLCRIRYTSNYRIEKENVINKKNGLQSLFINKILIDKEANLWFGSTGAGLFQFLSSRFESYNSNNYLPFDDVRTIAVDDSTNIYITDNKKVYAFNINGKLNANFDLIPKTSEEEIKTSYLNKPNHELWIGTSQNIYIYNYFDNKMVFKGDVPNFKNKSINFITKDQSGQFLICTTEGLYYVDEKFNIKKVFNTDLGAPHNNFIGAFVDRSDRLWAFSPETPVYSLFGQEVELEKVIYSDKDTTAPFKFNSAVQDRDDNIWFATEGDGIYCYKKNRNPKFTHYTTEEGLSSDFCYGIAVTLKGDIIATHKNGISIKYANVKTFRVFNKSMGLPANNLNSNAIFRGRVGTIWMGSTEGIVRYLPNEDNKNVNAPIFSFLSIVTNSVAQPSLTDSIYKLEYNKYELVINFVGVSLTNPDGVTYRYMLEGFDDKFRTTSEENVVYPLLEDGDYKFIIYAKNSDGFEMGSPATFRISIDKPFWKKIWFIASVSIFVILIFFIVFRIRTKKLLRDKKILEDLVQEKTGELVLEKEKIEKANEELNEKNQDITASIAYAKRIQTAVLPDPEYMTRKLGLFVFYKPRDIVSGDFYWYTESDRFSYVAVVDCTGHGVPGAFMSLLGSTFLDQVLIENKNSTPALILNELDKKLHKAFRKKEEENRIGDGMDAIVVRVDKTNGELMFSGANRPLYYYSKEGPQDFKAPIYSIGGTFPNEVKGFTDTILKPSEGDCAYLFSDGFGDQFGGEKNKRYSTKRMKAFFGEIYTHPIKKQHEMTALEFETWMGDYEQMDDICVIGIKF